MDEEVKYKLAQFEERLNALGRQITAMKEAYDKILIEVQILKEGDNL